MADQESESPGPKSPSADVVLSALLRFGRTMLVERSEQQTAEQFLALLDEVFPARYFLLRLVDLRGGRRVRVYGQSSRVRSDLEFGQIRLRQTALTKTHLKAAVTASALLSVTERWDSPFSGVAVGFSIPLAMAGELFGVLDVGYSLGQDNSEADEKLLLPLVNQLAAALRNERLYHDTKSLRDYQARLIEHARALILGIDSEWRIRVCNKALCDLIGLPGTDVIGQDLREFFPVVDRANLNRLFSDGMQGDDEAWGESQVVSASGRPVPVVWRVASIRSRGRVQAVVAVGQDMSVLSDLQKQLVQAEKLSTLGQIAAGVVHELNNPLTAIGVYSDFLLRKAEKQAADSGTPADEDDLDKLRTIRDGAERIKIFTRDLMQYAKPSPGARERLSLNKVITQSLSFCEHLFNETGVVLERDLDTDLPDVHVVPGQFEQVIINLVTNAVQACNGKGSVAVRSYAKDDKVVLSVKDGGPGIASDLQERIFEPFFTTKTDGEGTGLGLCIVRNIIEENSGTLFLDSAIGAGSEFRCVVPALRESS